MLLLLIHFNIDWWNFYVVGYVIKRRLYEKSK